MSLTPYSNRTRIGGTGINTLLIKVDDEEYKDWKRNKLAAKGIDSDLAFVDQE
jgi:hypothetical protein